MLKDENREINALKDTLERLNKSKQILLAYLYGSYASDKNHIRSDIDLAVYVNSLDENERIEIIDNILMATERQIDLLCLDDEYESPFIVQRALKGIPLIEPHKETYYKVAHKALHESEEIRFRRQLSGIYEK